MKSKSLILMVVSLGFGLIAAIGISQVMGNNKQVEPTVERAQVLVAAKSLKNGGRPDRRKRKDRTLAD